MKNPLTIPKEQREEIYSLAYELLVEGILDPCNPDLPTKLKEAPNRLAEFAESKLENVAAEVFAEYVSSYKFYQDWLHSGREWYWTMEGIEKAKEARYVDNRFLEDTKARAYINNLFDLIADWPQKIASSIVPKTGPQSLKEESYERAVKEMADLLRKNMPVYRDPEQINPLSNNYLISMRQVFERMISGEENFETAVGGILVQQQPLCEG